MTVAPVGSQVPDITVFTSCGVGVTRVGVRLFGRHSTLLLIAAHGCMLRRYS